MSGALRRKNTVPPELMWIRGLQRERTVDDSLVTFVARVASGEMSSNCKGRTGVRVDAPHASRASERFVIVEQPMTDLEALYAGHFHNLSVQLYAYTGDLGVAQELVQEAFTRAVPRWPTIAMYDDPLAWIRRVAFNLAKSRWRRMRTAAAFERKHRDEVVPEPSADRVLLVAALAKLPLKQRRVVVLHHLADLPIAEIARTEGVPEGTVRVWLHRGRAALAEQLADSRSERRDV
jgi:RNA polymerase sigma-70 factor, ECF subfamily